jgi:hypothetical protein
MMEENNQLGDPEPPGDGSTTNTAAPQAGDPEPPGGQAVSAYSDTTLPVTTPSALGDPEPPGSTGDPEPPGGSSTGSGSGTT